MADRTQVGGKVNTIKEIKLLALFLAALRIGLKPLRREATLITRCFLKQTVNQIGKGVVTNV